MVLFALLHFASYSLALLDTLGNCQQMSTNFKLISWAWLMSPLLHLHWNSNFCQLQWDIFLFSYIYSFLLPTCNGFCRPKLLVGRKDAYISSRIPVKKYSQVLLSKIKTTIKLCDKKCEMILLLYSPEWWRSMRSSWCPSASWWFSQVQSQRHFCSLPW